MTHIFTEVQQAIEDLPEEYSDQMLIGLICREKWTMEIRCSRPGRSAGFRWHHKGGKLSSYARAKPSYSAMNTCLNCRLEQAQWNSASPTFCLDMIAVMTGGPVSISGAMGCEDAYVCQLYFEIHWTTQIIFSFLWNDGSNLWFRVHEVSCELIAPSVCLIVEDLIAGCQRAAWLLTRCQRESDCQAREQEEEEQERAVGSCHLLQTLCEHKPTIGGRIYADIS